MKQLILHIGLHKTATSSIQDTLAYNQKLLAENRIHYPIFKSYNNKNMTNHSMAMHSLFCDSPNKYRMNIVNKWDASVVNPLYEEQLRDAAEKANTLLISGEGISALKENELFRLKEFFYDFNIRVICFVRDAYGYHCSALQERIKNGHELLSENKLLTTSFKFKHIKAVFPDVEYYSFKDACQFNGGAVRFFLSLLPLKNAEKFVEKKSNEGLGYHSTRLLNYINKTVPLFIDGKLNEEREGFVPKKLVFDSAKFKLKENELAVIEHQLEAENLEIKKHTGLDFISTRLDLGTVDGPSIEEVIALIKQAKTQPRTIRDLVKRYCLKNDFASTTQLDTLDKRDVLQAIYDKTLTKGKSAINRFNLKW